MSTYETKTCKCCDGTGKVTEPKFQPGTYYEGNFTIVQAFKKREPIVMFHKGVWGSAVNKAYRLKEQNGAKVKIYEENKLRLEL